MTERFEAAHLITMANGHADPSTGEPQVFSPSVVDVVDGVVDYTGSPQGAPQFRQRVTKVDGLLAPGFVNSHAHTPMVLPRGTGEGLQTQRWLTEVMWPREARITGDDAYWATQYGCYEMLRSGITTSSEMYFHANDVARGAAAAGMRCIVAAPISEAAALATFGSVAHQIEALHDMRSQWGGHALVEVGVGPHAVYTLSRDALSAVAQAAASDPMLVHIHVAEQPGEAAFVEAESEISVPFYLDEIGLLVGRTLAAHCVWLTDADIELLAERGTGVAHCPVSNGRHASGIAPVAAMHGAGISVGLCTDGPVSHDRLDMFEEVRTAARFARVNQMDAAQMGVGEMLAMMTSKAADAIGRSNLGRLAPGCRADMIAADVEAPSFSPILDPSELLGRLVWAGTPASVTDVWVQGERVVTNGVPARLDPLELRAKISEVAHRLARAESPV